MMPTERRYLVLELVHGRYVPSIEYGDHRRTRELIYRKRAKRIAITPIQAMYGPRKLMALAMAGGNR